MELAIGAVNALFDGGSPAGEPRGELASNLRFSPSGAIAFSPDARSLLGGGLDPDVAAEISGKRPPASGLPTGLFELHDVHLAPPHGAIFDFANRRCWMGSLLGWNARDFRIWTERLPGCVFSGTRLMLEPPPRSSTVECDAAVLVSAPHYEGYGHWLLDFLPRLTMAGAFGLADLPVYREPAHDWARALSGAVAPLRFLDAKQLGAGWVRVKRLYVPSVARIRHTADAAALAATWTRLGAVLDQAPDGAGAAGSGPRRIVVSRRSWTDSQNKRRLLNAADIEAQLEARGFTVVHPQDLSLAEQRRIFRNAGIVLGEDGSALHNTVHCRAGTRIGIYAMGRINPVHLMTAQMLGHRVTYIPTEPVTDHEASALLDIRRLAPEALDEALGRLMQGQETR